MENTWKLLHKEFPELNLIVKYNKNKGTLTFSGNQTPWPTRNISTVLSYKIDHDYSIEIRQAQYPAIYIHEHLVSFYIGGSIKNPIDGFSIENGIYRNTPTISRLLKSLNRNFRTFNINPLITVI
jgi:hypothetical protein